ncbi:hypothetical protein ARMSODRAFT_978761 [Armillaria solidipes]|uniref:Uncharacterized protein n=1 Tax=Armillaria solidipes TaxID=1076256 RepID=A0A2H3B1L9_9AGAR|nr:hypothetical protein ARMSODRAFT_978761 [Armillaria solidipes]
MVLAGNHTLGRWLSTCFACWFHKWPELKPEIFFEEERREDMATRRNTIVQLLVLGLERQWFQNGYDNSVRKSWSDCTVPTRPATSRRGNCNAKRFVIDPDHASGNQTYIALTVRGDYGALYDWVQAFTVGWQSRFPIFWEDITVNCAHVTKGLSWMYHRVHKDTAPQDLEANGPVDTDIKWVVPTAHRDPKPRGFWPISYMVVLDGEPVTADMMGHTMTSRIRHKQEVADKVARTPKVIIDHDL